MRDRELRWQLITNRKSRIGFRLQQQDFEWLWTSIHYNGSNSACCYGRGCVSWIKSLNQPSGVESIEMHVALTSKYGSRVLLAMYTAIEMDQYELYNYKNKALDIFKVFDRVNGYKLFNVLIYRWLRRQFIALYLIGLLNVLSVCGRRLHSPLSLKF